MLFSTALVFFKLIQLVYNINTYPTIYGDEYLKIAEELKRHAESYYTEIGGNKVINKSTSTETHLISTEVSSMLKYNLHYALLQLTSHRIFVTFFESSTQLGLYKTQHTISVNMYERTLCDLTPMISDFLYMSVTKSDNTNSSDIYKQLYKCCHLLENILREDCSKITETPSKYQCSKTVLDKLKGIAFSQEEINASERNYNTVRDIEYITSIYDTIQKFDIPILEGSSDLNEISLIHAPVELSDQTIKINKNLKSINDVYKKHMIEKCNAKTLSNNKTHNTELNTIHHLMLYTLDIIYIYFSKDRIPNWINSKKNNNNWEINLSSNQEPYMLNTTCKQISTILYYLKNDIDDQINNNEKLISMYLSLCDDPKDYLKVRCPNSMISQIDKTSYDRECIEAALYNKIYINYYLINQRIIPKYTFLTPACSNKGLEYIKNIFMNLKNGDKNGPLNIWTFDFLSGKFFFKNNFLNTMKVDDIQNLTIKVKDENWTVSGFNSVLLPLSLNWKTISKLQHIILSNIDRTKNEFLFRQMKTIATYLEENTNKISESTIKQISNSFDLNKNIIKEFNRLISLTGTYEPLINHELIIDCILNSDPKETSKIIQTKIPLVMENEINKWMLNEKEFKTKNTSQYLRKYILINMAYESCVNGVQFINDFISSVNKSIKGDQSSNILSRNNSQCNILKINWNTF